MYNNHPTAATKIAARNKELLEQRRRRAARNSRIIKTLLKVMLTAIVALVIYKSI